MGMGAGRPSVKAVQPLNLLKASRMSSGPSWLPADASLPQWLAMAFADSPVRPKPVPLPPQP